MMVTYKFQPIGQYIKIYKSLTQKVIGAFLFLFFFLSTHAQVDLTTSDVLATAKNEYSIQLQQQRVDVLKNLESKLPLVDEIEFRTETNDFELKEQQYAVRARFHTRKEQKAQKDLHQAKIELNSIEEKILIHELLEDRYVGILEAIYFERLIDTKKEQVLILEDRLTVYKRSINLPSFDITDMIDAEDELHAAELGILKLENAAKFAQQKIYNWSANQGFLKVENIKLISLDELMESMRMLPTEPSASHADLVKRNLNATMAIREQEVRKAREENTFEYFQARIGGTDKQGIKQNLTLGLGIRIPVRNTEELDLAELEFERMDEETKYKELQIALTDRMARIRLEMEHQYQLYQLLQKQLENSQADFALKQYQKIAGASPLALLKLKGSRFNKELEQFSIEQEIYMLYIELLDASGKMAELPLRNYLLSSQPSF